MADSQEDWSEKLIVKYIGQKISKVRWKPSYYGQLRTADRFITGSWDDEKNLVCLWSVDGSEGEDKYFENEATDGEPEMLCSVQHVGSVTDIQFITSDHFITSSSSGTLNLYEISKDQSEFFLQKSWPRVHNFGKEDSSSCTSVSVSQSNFASSGEDGRINVMQLEHRDPVRAIDNADCVTITSIVHTHSNEVATTNAIGQLKMWDLKQSGNKPAKIMSLSGEKVSLECADRHPYQPYLVITGSSDGVVAVWDLRNECYPLAVIDAHESEVWELQFHSQYPDNLFTCSEDGSSWYWDGASMATTATALTRKDEVIPFPNMDGSLSRKEMQQQQQQQQQQSISPWLLAGTKKDMLETYSLLPVNNLPVNSLDVDGRSLICGTDGEAIIIVQDLPLK